LAEIDGYRAHYGQHHYIYFGDETFTVNRIRTVALCEALSDAGHIHYDCQTRLNLLKDTAMLQAIQRSGCRWVEIGIESADQLTQDIFKQRVPIRTLRETLRRVRDCGLATCSFLVNGFPHQTTSDMRRSIDTIAELIAADLLTATYLFGLVPYPGSRIFATPEKYGMRLHHRNFRYYHEDMPPVYDTHAAKSDEIYQVFLDGLQTLADAMACPADEKHTSSHFGAFWRDSHV
jgi:radical SAM superfamily enzyme YgiQ (UPF0313 family)